MYVFKYCLRNIFFGNVDRADLLRIARAMIRAFVGAVCVASLTIVIFIAFAFPRKSVAILIVLM